ncbi:MAG: adenylyltransferase/cytidyltransferase family protein [Verrucomicrobiota bacterium]|nr:adenylyltransferase/cytidyltransferase family protein [Verrucomicrobiota bacterium]
MTRGVVSVDELAAASAELRANGKRLVVTNGCFDLLHLGHVRYLQAARALGDALAVGVNGDDSVRALKGEGRPLNSEDARAEVLAALRAVNYVAVFPDVRATDFLQRVRPAVYAKGGDYTPESLNPEERAVLDATGAEIRIIPFEDGFSTTELIERMGTA